MTGQRAWRTTECETLPISALLKAPRPRLPKTMSPAPRCPPPPPAGAPPCPPHLLLEPRLGRFLSALLHPPLEFRVEGYGTRRLVEDGRHVPHIDYVQLGAG